MYLVTYIGDNEKTKEVLLKYKSDFNNWLYVHNRKREKEGAIPEQEFEFEIEFVEVFKG